jgi:SAM-dependent methyltransferase
MNPTRQIEQCRLCGCTALRPIIDFGLVPLGNNLLASREQALAATAYPLDLKRCEGCGHFQLGHAVAPELLYATNYTYLSGIGASFRKHFAEYADWAVARCALSPESLVVDIGSNDGTCLAAFQRLGVRVCGVDPAQMPAAIANERGIETINAFFDADVVDAIKAKHGQATLITSHNVLAHVDDLGAVFRNIWSLLAPGGWFCFEIGYVRDVLKNNFFDTIYHEHLDYHHASPLVSHLTALGFSVEGLSTNAIQGGSLRLLLRKNEAHSVSETARAFLEEEKNSAVNDLFFLDGWEGQIKQKMAKFRSLVRQEVAAGASIAAYGAPTKAVLLMKMAELSAVEIPYVAEDNDLKVGRYLPGTGIPIVSTAQLFERQPNVVVLLAWNFASDIIARLKPHLTGRAKVIVPLPEPAVISL